jgi:hypothetical protein
MCAYSVFMDTEKFLCVYELKFYALVDLSSSPYFAPTGISILYLYVLRLYTYGCKCSMCEWVKMLCFSRPPLFALFYTYRNKYFIFVFVNVVNLMFSMCMSQSSMLWQTSALRLITPTGKTPFLCLYVWILCTFGR